MYFHVEGEGVTLTEMQGGGSQLWETRVPVCPCWEQRGQRSADGGPLPVVSLNHVVLEQSYAPPLPAAAAVNAAFEHVAETEAAWPAEPRAFQKQVLIPKRGLRGDDITLCAFVPI